MKLPPFVVCNVNRFKKSKVNEYNMTMRMVDYMFANLNLVFNVFNVFDDDFMSPDLSEEANFVTWRRGNNFSYMDIFDHLGPKCEDLFVQGCTSSSAFIEPIDTIEYGRCYRVSINKTTGIVGRHLLAR